MYTVLNWKGHKISAWLIKYWSTLFQLKTDPKNIFKYTNSLWHISVCYAYRLKKIHRQCGYRRIITIEESKSNRWEVRYLTCSGIVLKIYHALFCVKYFCCRNLLNCRKFLLNLSNLNERMHKLCLKSCIFYN
jgi:hypothetical protein